MELTQFVIFCTIFYVPVTSVSIQLQSQDLLENKDGIFVCKFEESKPEASFQWIITYKNGSPQKIQQNSTISKTPKGKLWLISSTLKLNLKRDYEKIMCKARTENMPWRNSKYLLLYIKYPPEGKPRIILSQSGVCIGKSIEIKCEWKGGYPKASITLSCLSEVKEGESSVSIKKAVTQKMKRDCICNGNHIAKHDFMRKTVNIQYPPYKVTINQASYLEGYTVSLICEASGGNPAIYNYSWLPGYFPPRKTIDIYLTRTMNKERFTCNVYHKCKGGNPISSTIEINVEYYPIINTSDNMTVIENQINKFSCLAEGNPKPTITWKIRNQIYKSKLLQVSFTRFNVSKVQCIATANSSKHGILKSSKNIYIFVKYSPVITIHHNVTNLQQKAQISCTAHANPNNIQYRIVQKWGTIIKKDIPKNHVTIQNVSFQDMGTWICLASNDIPKKNYYSEKSTEIKLNVAAHFKGDKKKYALHKTTVNLKICFYCYPEATRVIWYEGNRIMPDHQISYVPAEDGLFPFSGKCSILEVYIKKNGTQVYSLKVINPVGERIFKLTLDSKTPLIIILASVLGAKLLTVVIVFSIVGIISAVSKRNEKRKKKCKKKTRSEVHEAAATIDDINLDPGTTTEYEIPYDDVQNTSINQNDKLPAESGYEKLDDITTGSGKKDGNQPEYVNIIDNTTAKGQTDGNQPRCNEMKNSSPIKGKKDGNQPEYVNIIDNTTAKGQTDGNQPRCNEMKNSSPIKGKKDGNQPEYVNIIDNTTAKGHLDYEDL